MPLNNLSLTDSLVQELYTRHLVLTKDEVQGATRESTVSPETPPAPIQFLGKNNRRFVILVNEPQAVHITDSSFEFLGNILKACQLNAADVAIVNLGKQQFAADHLINSLEPEFIADFSETEIGLPAQAALLVPYRSPNFQYLKAPSLEQLNQATDAVKPMKRQLWEALKQMLAI